MPAPASAPPERSCPQKTSASPATTWGLSSLGGHPASCSCTLASRLSCPGPLTQCCDTRGDIELPLSSTRLPETLLVTSRYQAEGRIADWEETGPGVFLTPDIPRSWGSPSSWVVSASSIHSSPVCHSWTFAELAPHECAHIRSQGNISVGFHPIGEGLLQSLLWAWAL